MKSCPDDGTARVDCDVAPPRTAVAATPPRSLFPDDDGDRRRWRVRPAELARMLGTSKQSISRAIRDGKILLGPDGKVNPEQATAQYLRHSDPARLRARLLAPFVRDLQAAQAREAAMRAELERLRAELADCEEAHDFEATAASELVNVCDAFALAVVDLWHELVAVDPEVRADFLAGLPGALTESWHALAALNRSERAAYLRGRLEKKLEASEPDADCAEDFLAAVDPPSAAVATAKGEWRKGQPTNEDEGHDDHP